MLNRPTSLLFVILIGLTSAWPVWAGSSYVTMTTALEHEVEIVQSCLRDHESRRDAIQLKIDHLAAQPRRTRGDDVRWMQLTTSIVRLFRRIAILQQTLELRQAKVAELQNAEPSPEGLPVNHFWTELFLNWRGADRAFARDKVLPPADFLHQGLWVRFGDLPAQILAWGEEDESLAIRTTQGNVTVPYWQLQLPAPLADFRVGQRIQLRSSLNHPSQEPNQILATFADGAVVAIGLRGGVRLLNHDQFRPTWTARTGRAVLAKCNAWLEKRAP